LRQAGVPMPEGILTVEEFTREFAKIMERQ